MGIIIIIVIVIVVVYVVVKIIGTSVDDVPSPVSEIQKVEVHMTDFSDEAPERFLINQYGEIGLPIVGIPYHDFANIREATNLEVFLMAEPNNQYDKNAVAVHEMAGEKVGYLPKEENGEISRFLHSKQQEVAKDKRAIIIGIAQLWYSEPAGAVRGKVIPKK